MDPLTGRLDRIGLNKTRTAEIPAEIQTRATCMKSGFTLIQLEDYVAGHMQANPSVDRADLVRRLRNAIEAVKRGDRCSCGGTIWIVGSAEVGLRCFTCITGEEVPDSDFEIDLG